MINPTKEIKMTGIEYIPQFTGYLNRHYNTDCYTVKVDLERIYFNKYSKIDYNSVINSFKVVVC